MNKKNKIFKKANGRCAHCGKIIKKGTFTIDHFVPKSFLGTLNIENLFPLCRECNEDRGNEFVDAKEFYSFADDFYIKQANNYLKNWKKNNSNSYKELFTNF